MNKIPTNSLTIRLIKQKYSSLEALFKNYNALGKKDLPQNAGTLYYEETRTSEPSWIKGFFDKSFEGDSVVIKNSNPKAVLLVPITDVTFALTFGYGHTLLNPGMWEERFGLKVALNTVDLEHLRGISRRNMTLSPKNSTEQVTKLGSFADFGIDIEQDLIQGITGKSKEEGFGKTITGKDFLKISARYNISNIKTLLEKCYKKYNSNYYKENGYGWIDHICEIKTPQTIDRLNNTLIKKIKNESLDRVWMAVPEIIRWENTSHFKFKRNTLGDDIDLRSYWDSLKKEEREDFSINTIKNHKIDCIGTSSDIATHTWRVYDCLYCEIEKNNSVYILNNGKWYQIENDFVKRVSDSFNSIRETDIEISMPECNNEEREDEYNERVARENNNIYCMDKKNINHGGINQKIEFCDLLTKDKQIIHVKHYGSSSVLSHLFHQGSVSGQLFLEDEEFRQKVNEKLPTKYKIANTSDKPKASEYKIIFAIISKSESGLNIPFFSKISIRNVKRGLDLLGYSVSLIKIPTKKE